MSLSIPRIVRPDGTVGRGAYAAVGLVLFAVKHNIDRFVASFVFHRHVTRDCREGWCSCSSRRS